MATLSDVSFIIHVYLYVDVHVFRIINAFGIIFLKKRKQRYIDTLCSYKIYRFIAAVL